MGLFTKVIILGISIAVISTGPLIQGLGGGSEIDYLVALENMQSFDSNIASSAYVSLSDNSIGLLLKPNNALQAFLYCLPRMLLYLVAPLPNVGFSVPELIEGSWSAWQSLMTIITSVLMLLGLPLALASASKAWSFRRNQPDLLELHVTFWITFVAVAAGNMIIHERYCIMFTLLLFACMWLGYTRCSIREIKLWALFWYGLLSVGAVFYVSYKPFV